MTYELAWYLQDEDKIINLKNRLCGLLKYDLIRGRDIIKEAETILEKKLSTSLLYLLMTENVIKKEEASHTVEDYIFSFNINKFESFFSDQLKAVPIFRDVSSNIGKKQLDAVDLIATVPPILAFGERIAEIELIDPSIKRLIINTNSELWIANPFFDAFGTASILPSLINAAKRGVKVKIITRGFYDKEIDNLLIESLMIIADAFRKSNVEDNLEIKDFFKRNTETGKQEYALHSKIVISDYDACYIGSANFTETSLKRNFELGVIIRGKKVKVVSDILKKVYKKSNYISYNDLNAFSKT